MILKFKKKMIEMKRSSALSTLQNASFRKGALRFSLCYLHIVTGTYYFEETHSQIFFHVVLSHEKKIDVLMPTIQNEILVCGWQVR